MQINIYLLIKMKFELEIIDQCLLPFFTRSFSFIPYLDEYNWLMKEVSIYHIHTFNGWFYKSYSNRSIKL